MSYEDIENPDELLAALERDREIMNQILLSYEMQAEAEREILEAEKRGKLLQGLGEI